MSKHKDKKSNHAPDGPKVDPPGRVESATGHGLPAPAPAKPHGSERLRSLMNLSADVGIERVCEEAASRLETGYADARNRKRRGG